MVLLLGAPALWASSMGRPPVLQPTYYDSRSREFTLHVNPSDYFGRGPADYILFNDDTMVWSNHLPFTFYGAWVLDDGTAVGLSYSQGPSGRSTNRDEGPGNLSFDVLSPSGDAVNLDTVERGGSIIDSYPEPLVEWVYISDDERQVLFQVSTEQQREAWWLYSLSGGPRKELSEEEGQALAFEWRKGPGPRIKSPCEVDPPAWPAALPNLAFPGVPSVQLDVQYANTNHAVSHVQGMALGTNQLCVVKGVFNEYLEGLLTSREGEVLATLTIPVEYFVKDTKVLGPVHIRNGRFLVGLSNLGFSPGITTCWILDYEAQRVEKILECPRLAFRELVAFEDGRFAALTMVRRGSGGSMDSGLYTFNADGTFCWMSCPRDPAGKQARVSSADGLAVTPDGKSLAVLGGYRYSLQVFDPETGELLSYVDLAETWGEPYHYTKTFSSDPEGYLVYQYSESNTMVRMDTRGVIQSVDPVLYADGRKLLLRDTLKHDPSGGYWGTDSKNVYYLDDQLKAQHALRPDHEKGQLDHAAHVHVDRNGRTYIVDGRSMHIYVYDEAGRHLFNCELPSERIPSTPNVTHMDLDHNGVIYGWFDYLEDYYETFDRSGKYLGPVSRLHRGVGNVWHFQPTSSRRWNIRYMDVLLSDLDTGDTQFILRRPDGHWLDDPGLACVGPNGALAVTAPPVSREASFSGILNFYHADGTPGAMVPLPLRAGKPLKHMMFNDRLILLKVDQGVVVMNRQGEGLGLFKPFDVEVQDSWAESWHGPFPIGSGEEAAFVDPAFRLHRFRLSGNAE